MTIQMSSPFLVALGAFALASALAACTDDAVAPAGTTAAALDTRGRPITDEELAKIVEQPAFAETLELVTEEGGEIDLAGGLVYTYADDVGGTETRFGVSTRGGAAAADDLVFQDLEAQSALFYFLGQAAGAEPKVAGRSRGDVTSSGWFGCGAWSSWYATGTHCGNHFWCFGAGQKGTYATYARSRQCKKGIQVANRTHFVGCGC